MANIRKMEFDGLLVGGGGQGCALLANCPVRFENMVITKVFPTRSHTVSALEV